MLTFSLSIDDAVAKASPVLRRMRLDGLDRATLPFKERYVQAWIGMPQPGMDAELLLNVIKVRGPSQSSGPRSAVHKLLSRPADCLALRSMALSENGLTAFCLPSEINHHGVFVIQHAPHTLAPLQF